MKFIIGMTGWMMSALLCAGGALADESVSEGKWFVHEFGELRSYHGDWLAVCDDEGAGPCRLVQYKLKGDGDTFFGESRLSVAQTSIDGEPNLIFDFFDRGAPDEPQGLVTLEIFPNSWVLTPGRDVTEAFTPGGGTVAESFQVRRPDLIDEIVAEMRSGSLLRLSYQGASERKKLVFSLRGFAAALAAIEQLKAPS